MSQASENIAAQYIAGAVNKKTWFELIINPRTYGAECDGIADDTEALQRAFDAAPQNSEIRITGKSRITSNLNFNTPRCRITGGGTIYGGRIVVGDKTGGTNMLDSSIENITFEYDTLQSGNVGVEFAKTRVCAVTSCLFINTDKSIYVAPDVNYAFHELSQIKINRNQFRNVNYPLYVDLYDDFTTNANRWMTCSDWEFNDNTANVAVIRGVHVRAIDGIHLNRNTFFFSSSTGLRDLKEKGVWIGQSDWVTMTGNHIFETGWEAIHLDTPKNFTITNNKIAWCGQREMRNSILISGDAGNQNGIIDNNTITLYTLHAVSLESTGSGVINVKGNRNLYDVNNTTYFGTPALSTVTHYNINQVRTTNVTAIESGNFINSADNITNNIKKRYGSSYRVSKRSHYAGTYVQQTLTTVLTQYSLVQLESVSNSNSSYDGMILINARSADLDSANTATYFLHVCKAASNSICTVVSSGGLTSGGAANHPSFTFALDTTTDVLKVTGVGSTQGLFHFYFTYMGNIEVIK
jgi:hypothetical protein